MLLTRLILLQTWIFHWALADDNSSSIATRNHTKRPNIIQIKTEEQKLLYHLLQGYERATRPVKNVSTAVLIKLGLTLTNIFDMDEKNQVLTTNVWLDQEWKDELLVWNPRHFGGIESIRIPCDLIWTPDLVLYNNADDYSRGYMRSRAMVYFDGTVFWPPPTQLRSTCKISVTYFPFDSQRCFMKFGSWTYHGFQVDVTNRSKNVDLTNYVVNGEFDLVNVYQKRTVLRYACCPEPYPDVTFFIHVRRKTLYYMYNVVFPCMMMSALTLLVFCLPPDSGEKIALGITVLLAFSVFVLAIAEKMPETSDSLPLIAIYLTLVMGVTSVSVIMTVMVLNFHYQGPFNRHPSEFIQLWILGRLRRCLCMTLPSELKIHSDSGEFSKLRRMSMQLVNGGDHSGANGNDWDFDRSYDNRTFSSDTTTLWSPTSRLPHRRVCCPPRNLLQEELLKTLRLLISRQELDDELEEIKSEWRSVAQVIDRLLFWIFTVATVTLTLVMLIVIPLLRYSVEAEELSRMQ